MVFWSEVVKELRIFFKLCWFLVVLLGVAFFLYFANARSHDKNEIILWCTLSYISSFVFYVLTIYMPNRRNHKNIHRVIIPYLKNVINDTHGVTATFLAASQVDCDRDHIMKGDFHKIFLKIKPTDQSARLEFFGFVNWIEYFQHQKNRAKHNLDRILTYEHYLDTDFILVVENTRNSALFETLDYIEKKPVNFENFAFLSDAYYQAKLQVDELETFLKKYMLDV